MINNTPSVVDEHPYGIFLMRTEFLAHQSGHVEV